MIELGEKSWTKIILSWQAIIKLWLACSFRIMYFVSWKLKHVHVTYSFDELLLFFWLTLVDIFCLKFDFSLHQRNTLHNSKGNNDKNSEIHFHLSQMLMLKNPSFCYVELKISNEQFSVFLSLMNTFLILISDLCRLEVLWHFFVCIRCFIVYK